MSPIDHLSEKSIEELQEIHEDFCVRAKIHSSHIRMVCWNGMLVKATTTMANRRTANGTYPSWQDVADEIREIYSNRSANELGRTDSVQDSSDPHKVCIHEFSVLLSGPKGFCTKCNRDGRLTSRGDVEWL